MKKTLITILVLVLVIAGGVWLFGGDGYEAPDDEGTTTPTSTEDGVSDVEDIEAPEGWEMYTNEEFDFSIAHPPEASVQQEAGNHIKFTVLGPDNATGEITDGFTFTVSTYDKPSGQTLEAFAEQRLETNLNVGDLVQDVEQVAYEGETAYTFTTDNLGETTHLVIDHSDERAIVISYNISDPNNSGYAETVDTMLSTFTRLESNGDDAAATVSQVNLAFLDTQQETGGEERGCDRVVMVEREIDPTTAPLTAAMEELFSLESETVAGWSNFMARTNDTLTFDRATVTDGTAEIYLEGELSGLRGVCDNPRAQIQISETAEQFATVEDVQIYLDGEPTDLTPDERGE